MGINPNAGDGVEKNYTIDGRHDAEGILSDSEHVGQEAGKVFAQIAAQADSANKGTSDLSKRVATLEAKASPDLSKYVTTDQLNTKQDKLTTSKTQGAGWSAIRIGPVVTVLVNGATTGWTMPEGYRPTSQAYLKLVDLTGKSATARAGFNPAGAVTFADTTGACYGTITYLSP